MPIYGFECTECQHQFDRLQKLSEDDPRLCPACGKETLRRQLTAPQFRLAGGGWYETDFKKDGDKKRNLADSGSSSSDASSATPAVAAATNNETKMAAKTDSKPAPAPSSPPPASSPDKSA